jgi:hypothetical protein
MQCTSLNKLLLLLLLLLLPLLWLEVRCHAAMLLNQPI